MPFALPEYDRAFSEFVGDAVYALARARSPLLSDIRFEATSSTVGSRIRGRAGVDVDLEPGKAGFEMRMTIDAVRAADFDQFLVELDQASDDLAEDLVGMFVTTMGKVTDATGNVVDAGGRKLDFEVIYEMLETMELGLGEDGELALPSLVMHPDDAEKLKDTEPLTEEQQARLDALKARKKEEALARRRRRRLS